jgi:hypothetical protein
MKAVVQGGDVIEALRERVLGRTASADIVNPDTDETMFEAGTLLTKILSMLDSKLPVLMKLKYVPR